MRDNLKASVIAVPPLARHADLSLNRDANAALIRYLEAGGIRSLMYGGNANFQNIGLYEYGAILDLFLELASPETWVIPSVGPDFGKMMDQADLLRPHPFPTVMLLPATAACTAAGIEAGMRRFVDRVQKKIIIYLRSESYLTPAAIERLVGFGFVRAIKYAIVRDDPGQDAFLGELVKRIDRDMIVSGFGERPAIVHMRDFGVASFTSGSVCVAPRTSQAFLAALRRQDYAVAERLRSLFIPLEDCRDLHGPVRVLHDGVTLAGIADMGPILPLLSNIEHENRRQVADAALTLRRVDDQDGTIAPASIQA